MNNKFSIIVPVYNGELTIEKCINSVLNQNYDYFEIVIVNDGSSDNTLKVLEKYKDNKNIKIINKLNSGVSDARNKGIKTSSFDWILFLDSDDWIEPDSLVNLNKLINEYNPDYIITELIYSNSKHESYNSFLVKDKNEIIDNIICTEYSKNINNKYMNCRCIGGKLVKRKLIEKKNICFPSGVKKFEDGIFNLKAVFESSSILYSSYQFYNYYYDNPNSRMNTFNEEEVKGNRAILKNITEFLKENNIKTESINYLSFYLFILSVDNIMHSKLSKKEVIGDLRNERKFYYPYFKDIKYKFLNGKKKIELFFSKMKNINLLYLIYLIKRDLLKK